jgi:hypothetical protein
MSNFDLGEASFVEAGRKRSSIFSRETETNLIAAVPERAIQEVDYWLLHGPATTPNAVTDWRT